MFKSELFFCILLKLQNFVAMSFEMCCVLVRKQTNKTIYVLKSRTKTEYYLICKHPLLVINCRQSLQLIRYVMGRFFNQVAPFEVSVRYADRDHVKICRNVGRYIANYS